MASRVSSVEAARLGEGPLTSARHAAEAGGLGLKMIGGAAEGTLLQQGVQGEA